MSPEVGQSLSDVVAAAAQHRKERIADGAFQGATCEAAVGFMWPMGSMALRRLRSAISLGVQAASRSADQDAGLVDAVATISAVDYGEIGALVSQDLHLLPCRAECMAIIRVAGKAAHADNKALIQRRGDADLAAKFITHPRLAFGDAVDFGLMQSVDLVATLGLLVQQLRDQVEFGRGIASRSEKPLSLNSIDRWVL